MTAARRVFPFDLDRFAAAIGGGRLFAIAVIGGAVIALAMAVVNRDHLFHFAATTADAPKEDLPTAYAAGVMALEGRYADAYDPAAFRAAVGVPDGALLWLNPPHAALVAAPLALMPYPAAKAAMLAATLFAMLLVARGAGLGRRVTLFAIAATPALYVSLHMLQVGVLCAGLLWAGLHHAARRPILAGFALALLTMKPQYGVLAPVFLIALQQWRTVAATVLWTGLMLFGAAAMFGAAPFAAFAGSIAVVHAGYADMLHPGSVTVVQTIGKLGGADALRVAAALCVACACAAAVWRAARRGKANEAIGLALVLTLVASPSAWTYDFFFATLGLLMIAAARPIWPTSLQIAAAVLWVAPTTPWLLSGVGGEVMPGLALLAAAPLLTAFVLDLSVPLKASTAA